MFGRRNYRDGAEQTRAEKGAVRSLESQVSLVRVSAQLLIPIEFVVEVW